MIDREQFLKDHKDINPISKEYFAEKINGINATIRYIESELNAIELEHKMSLLLMEITTLNKYSQVVINNTEEFYETIHQEKIERTEKLNFLLLESKKQLNVFEKKLKDDDYMEQYIDEILNELE